ncbi:MAG: stem cell self-renewal protein Piwi domain protein [Edaphobacter sp.]|nr:stem cell self-renewal protein Piwi domain protein [Edaphobacter sp.]
MAQTVSLVVHALSSQQSTTSTRFASQTEDTKSLDLNGFQLTLSGRTFKVRQSSYPDNSGLRELRKEHSDWILSWREGTLYAVPRVASPGTIIGTEADLNVDEHLPLIARLIEDVLPEKFPQYEAFWRRPFVFIGKKEELVSASLKNFRVRNDLVNRFTIRPTYTLEAKIIEPYADEVSLGLFLTANTKWEIDADLELLQKAGIDLSSLYVVRHSPKQDERRLVGQIRTLQAGVVHLSSSLMMSGIPTQEIRISKLSRSPYELQYILQNFSIALYAKMNGTPWTVNQDTTISDELIIGLGTSEISSSRFDRRTRYVGVTTVFRGDGNYLLGHVSKECSYEEYPQMLQDTTERVLSEIKQRNGWAAGDNVRLIFHTYKPLKNVEVAEIVKRAALVVGHDQTIEFAFLTVTVDHPFLVLDRRQNGIPTRTSVKGVLVPDRGTIVQIGRYTRLLCTNGPQLMKHEDAPLPAPLLVHIHKGSTFNDLTYLSEQILKFTGLSWRSTLPAKKPVSIYYSELIARMLGRLRSVRDWSPAVLNVKLRASRWFL